MEHNQRFEQWQRFLIQWESGVNPLSYDESTQHYYDSAATRAFSDDADDRGGATMMGVTWMVYELWCRINVHMPTPSVATLRTMPYHVWRGIVENIYWNPLRADSMAFDCVAVTIADWYWHSGRAAVKALQHYLGKTEDGVLGRNTLHSLNARCRTRASARAMAHDLIELRKAYLQRLVERRPSQTKFAKGWSRRLQALEEMFTQRMDLTEQELMDQRLERQLTRSYLKV